MSNTKNILLLEKALRFDRNNALGWGISLTLSALGFFVFTTTGNALGMLLHVVGLVFVVFALKLFYDAIRFWAVNSHPIHQIISRHPEQVVWVYSMATQLAPFGIDLYSTGQFYFKLENGREVVLRIPPKQLKPLSESLNAWLPTATFGYTEERDQWYEANPVLLRK